MAARKRKGRREKGSGSVYPLKNGKWQAALKIDGRVIRRNAASEQAAKAQLADLIDLHDQKINIGAAGQKLSIWLGAWLEQMARVLKPRTVADYRRQIETYILPALGDTPLDAVTADMLQTFFNALIDDIAANTRYDGVSTAHKLGMRLRAAFDLAIKRSLVRKNPMDGVILPEERAAKIEPPHEAQIAALLGLADAHPLAPLWHCYALLGLRLGEGVGLRWRDVDFDAGTIRIAQQVQTIPGQAGGAASRLDIGTPKSAAGERTLPAPPALMDRLRARRAAQLALRARRADTWEDNDLVFCNRDGGPLWPRRVSDNWYALREAAGLPDTTKLHHLRHALATLLDESGASDALKASILGHETRGVTQRYTHGRIAAMRRVLETVADKVMTRKVG